MRAIVVGHTVFTLAMFGLMWAVQIVVYPQFRNVAPDDFVGYATAHSSRIVVALVLLAPAEIAFALWLWLDTPDALSRTVVFLSGALLALGWLSTALWFGPLHGKFQGAYDSARIDLLILTNWFRTLLWTARAGFAAWFLWQLLEPATSSAP